MRAAFSIAMGLKPIAIKEQHLINPNKTKKQNNI